VKNANGWLRLVKMYNVVIDTNILVSGLISPRGHPAQIINALKMRRFNLFYDAEIMAEYEDVLKREKFGFNPHDVNELLDVITEIGMPVLIEKSTFHFDDEDDRAFYDVAVASGSYVITGNINDFPNEPFIIRPKDFMDKLNNLHTN